jgi:hypothetical protein
MAARPETDPKGKRPQPATDKDELEQYGVWVKAEPQDIAAEPEGASGLEVDFDLPEESETLPEESFLTEEEERLLGSFGDIDAEEGSSELSPIPEPDSDFSSLPEIEDFDVPADFDSGGTTKAPSASKTHAEPALDLSMDDLGPGYHEPSFGPHSELDMSSIEGLEDLETGKTGSLPSEEEFDLPADIELTEDLPVNRKLATEESIEGGLGPELEDVSAEFLDLGEAASATKQTKTGPSPAHDVTDEFLMDGGAAESSAAISEEADFEPLDIELQFDETLPATAAAGSQSETGFEEIGDFDDYLKDEVEPVTKESFDDLGALEKELSEELPPASESALPPLTPPLPAAAPAQDPSLANELLLKIANELSSIRSELVNLKSQLGGGRLEGVQAAVPPPVEEEPPKQPGGFFDDEDDEKIALTGDELDNILNSADFTEETPTFEPGTSPDELLASTELDLGAETGDRHDHDEGFLDETLLPESGDYSLEKQAEEPVERISLEEEPAAAEASFEEPASFGEEPHETLLKLADEGINPLTPAPEDTSYLEEPLSSEALPDLGETPFVEAPLVEPDLSELSIDMPLGGDEDELAAELPLDHTEESLPDLALDLEASASETVEGLDLIPDEAKPEFEESEYEEISLAHEGDEKAGSLDEEPFVEFLDEESLPEESLLKEEKTPSPRPQTKAREEIIHPDDIAQSLDEDLFVAKPEEPEEEISLSSRGEETPAEKAIPRSPAKPAAAAAAEDPSDKLKSDIRSVLSYLDRLLESLPEEKIEEFAHSEHFDTYKKLFEELGLV